MNAPTISNLKNCQSLSIQEAVAKYELDYQIDKTRLFAEIPGEGIVPSNFYALFRTDTGTILAKSKPIKEQYIPLQNFEMFDTFRELIGDSPVVGGGQFKQGAIAYLQALLPNDFVIGAEDEHKCFLTVLADHTGTGSSPIALYIKRLACSNGMLFTVKHSIMRISHKGDVQRKLIDVEKSMQTIHLKVNQYAELMNALREIQVNRQDLESYYKNLTLTPKEKKGEESELSTRIKNTRASLLEWFETSPGNDMEDVKGSAYAAFQAATYWVDNERGGENAAKRFESGMVGSGLTLKNKALELAQETWLR